MVYLHFPSQYTEEEEMLQKKYQKLKKKKKAIQQLKAPKPEPSPIQNPLKCSSEAKQDAKEVAKKLLKSGAISAIKVENKERQGFKRPKTLERRKSGPEKPGTPLTGYQPFASSHSLEEGLEPSPSPPPVISRPAVKDLYESFVNPQHDPIRGAEGNPSPRKPIKPRQGNTVYVHGDGVTEDILRNSFSSFGKIININMELDKNCGFITFESMESADKSIAKMNRTMVSNVQLNVSLARRQPMITVPVVGTPPSSVSWSSIASSLNENGTHQDKRASTTLPTYEDDLFNA